MYNLEGTFTWRTFHERLQAFRYSTGTVVCGTGRINTTVTSEIRDEHFLLLDSRRYAILAPCMTAEKW